MSELDGDLLAELRASNESRLTELAERGLPLDTDVDRIGTMLEVLLNHAGGTMLTQAAQLLHEGRTADKLDLAEAKLVELEAEARKRALHPASSVLVDDKGRLAPTPGRR